MQLFEKLWPVGGRAGQRRERGTAVGLCTFRKLCADEGRTSPNALLPNWHAAAAAVRGAACEIRCPSTRNMMAFAGLSAVLDGMYWMERQLHKSTAPPVMLLPLAKGGNYRARGALSKLHTSPVQGNKVTQANTYCVRF
jgi:hypothetical protein